MIAQRIAALKARVSDTALILETDGRKYALSQQELTSCVGADAIKHALEAKVGKALSVYIHVNRDGSLAMAINQEPLPWPEDEPDWDLMSDG